MSYIKWPLSAEHVGPFEICEDRDHERVRMPVLVTAANALHERVEAWDNFARECPAEFRRALAYLKDADCVGTARLIESHLAKLQSLLGETR